jgi:biotin carboxylase
MQTIVFLETYKSGSSREAIRAAERLGYYVVVFTGKQKRIDQRTEYTEVHEMYLIDLSDLERLKEKIRELQKQGKIIRSIISFIDSHVHTAGILFKHFCDHRFLIDPILKMENKILTRNTLKNTINNTNYVTYRKENLKNFMNKIPIRFPMIMKLPDSTGSKDVLLAKNFRKARKYVHKLREKSFNSPILFEEYVKGPQYLVETIVYKGQVKIVAIIEQEILKQKRFIVTGYLVMKEVPPALLASLTKTVNAIIKKFGVENGACHLELRLHNRIWKLIEINPRMSGGAMNKMIEFAHGINLAEQIIQTSLGKEPDLQRKQEKWVFTQYLTVPFSGKLKRVTGIKRASRYEGVEEVYLKPKRGTYLQTPISMGCRYAYVIASSPNAEEAKKIAKTAADEITFHME